MHYIPLASRVIMEEIQEGNRTNAGLWVPDVARKNKSVAFGKVIAVGPGRLNSEGRLVPVHVAVGDIVLFPRQAPAVLPLTDDAGDEHEVLMCSETDIIAVVHGLARESSIIGSDGAPLSLQPVSHALPDMVYANRESLTEAMMDLRQSGAPPEVLHELMTEHVDQHEGSAEVIEQ